MRTIKFETLVGFILSLEEQITYKNIYDIRDKFEKRYSDIYLEVNSDAIDQVLYDYHLTLNESTDEEGIGVITRMIPIININYNSLFIMSKLDLEAILSKIEIRTLTKLVQKYNRKNNKN